MKITITLVTLFIFQALFAQDSQQLLEHANALLREQNFEEAIPILKQAAENQSAEAQYNLGVCYQFGYGLEKDDSLATHWYLKAALNGWTDAEYKMSYAYIRGKGVEQDSVKAFEFTQKCAAKNDVDCLFNLTNCYLDGIGTEKSIPKMLETAQKLALLEITDNLQRNGTITSARLNLAQMFMNGNKTGKDEKMAFVWFLIYNESKDNFSIRVQQEQLSYIEKIENKLSKSDRQELIQKAENLLGHSLKKLEELHQTSR